MTTEALNLNELQDLIQSSKLEMYEGEESQETEVYITRDISEYIQLLNKKHEDELSEGRLGVDKCFSPTLPFYPFYDYELITNAKAFMTGPVCMYDKKTHAAETVRMNSLKELKDYLKDKAYILYYAFTLIRTHKFKSDSFELERLETPEVDFLFRGVILNK